MRPCIADHPVSVRFRRALDQLYGTKLERVVLFGSRARGDARPDSDWDIAVFLHHQESLWTEAKRLSEIGLSILDDTGEVINALPFKAGSYKERTGLMHELRREGIDI